MTQGVIAGIVGGLVVALILSLVSWAREKSQQKHESRMRLRDERIGAYSEVLKATSGVDAKDKRTIDLGIADVLRAVSVAQMVAGGDQEVLDALEKLRKSWNALAEQAEQTKVSIKQLDDSEHPKTQKRIDDNKARRQDFLDATWKQTGTGG